MPTKPHSAGDADPNDPKIQAYKAAGVPTIDLTPLEQREIFLPVPMSGDPSNGLKGIGSFDTMPFGPFAVIAKNAGAYLYNVEPALHKYATIFENGKWFWVDIENDTITEERATIVAKAIMASPEGWEDNRQFWNANVEWFPITFWANDVKEPDALTVAVYAWHNSENLAAANGEAAIVFNTRNWRVVFDLEAMSLSSVMPAEIQAQ